MGEVVHGTAVAEAGRAVLILGRAGAGKSSLALDLMAFGAGLIADDRVVLSATDGALIAAPPAASPALIEARGIGLLPLPLGARARLSLVVDLDIEAQERLPERRFWSLFGISVPLIGKARAAAVLAALRSGGPVDPEGPISSRNG